MKGVIKMKSLRRAGLVGMMALSLLSLASCGTYNNNSGTSDSGKDKDSTIHFVAVSNTEWDAEVSAGQHKYKMSMDMTKDNKVTFTATCTGKGSSGGQGGPGGGMGPGGMGGGQQQQTSETSETPEQLASFNQSYDGTWSEEKGYGYVINLNDSAKTVIHTDYEQLQGRHQFYYNFTTTEGSNVILFQFKDSAFRKTLASDYKTWDERDSKYIFSGTTTGNNNSVATAYLYAHSDNSAIINTANGSERKVIMGLKWKEENNVFTLIDKDKSYVADNSVNTLNSGMRLAYSSTTYFYSKNGNNNSMTNEDFDGKTLYQFIGSYSMQGPDGGEKKVELNLTDNNNSMYLYTNGSLTKKGTYSFADDKFTLTFEGEDAVEVTKNDAGNYVYSFQISVSSFFGTSTVDVVLTYTPSK